MKKTFGLLAFCMLWAASAATAQHVPNQNNCISAQVKQFYPGQSGSETLYMTNHCNYGVNVDLAVNQGGIVFLVQLNPGMERPTGDMGNLLSSSYQFWYCPMPEFPSDPNNNPLDGPKYGASGVVCRK